MRETMSCPFLSRLAMIEHTGSYLQQPMCAVWCPPHWLFLDEACADHPVDRRFDELSGNRLAVPMTISVIRYRRHVARYVIPEFLEFFLQLRRARRFSSDIPGQLVERAQCAMRAAVPRAAYFPCQEYRL
jgi:hypothetical protein